MALSAEKMRWDPLPVGDTRPAMKGGLPFWLLFPIFFGPAIAVMFTFNILLLFLTPILWVSIAACFVGNPNRPYEWLMWVRSGMAFADWSYWGGASVDPHSGTRETDLFL